MNLIQTRFKDASTLAIILALVMILTSLVIYITGLLYLWGGSIGIVVHGIIFIITLIVLLVKWKAKEVEVAYWNAVQFIVLVVIIYVAAMFIFDLIFFKFIVPDYYSELRDRTISMMIEYNVPEASIAEAEEQFDKGAASSTPFGLSLNKVVSRLFLDVILTFILAAFFRKKPSSDTATTVIS